MTDAELSRELALALGYYPESVQIGREELSCQDPDTLTRKTYRHDCEVFGAWHGHYPYWRDFDYRDSTVCLPLIKWLMNRKIFFTHDPVFPHWVIARACPGEMDRSYSTLEEAVCRAVIAVRKG